MHKLLSISVLLTSLFASHLAAQNTVPSLQHPLAAYHYSTPAAQVRSLDHISVRFVNPGAQPVMDVLVKAEIHEPGGQVVTLSRELDWVDAGADTLVMFPSYMPPQIAGDFTVVYSNSAYTSSVDTVQRKFAQSLYSGFASNNNTIIPGGVGLSDSAFIAADFTLQFGSLFYTGSNFTYWHPHVKFGIANTDEVYVPFDPTANIIAILLYDADPFDEGGIHFDTTWENLGVGLVGFGEYEIKGFEHEFILVPGYIENIMTSGDDLDLKPNHPYYISLYYNGLQAGAGKCVRFSKSSKEAYFDFPSTPLFAGQMIRDGWEEGTPVLEFHPEAFYDNTESPLSPDKYSISPNPASSSLQVTLDLDQPNATVVVSLINAQGRQLQYQQLQGFQNGVVVFDTRDMPAGMYLVRIATEEGRGVKKVMVGH
ncbi:MAG: T9SS type A sorting domain-containing protein [Chitinophagales bacterium]|nr:T9SS type A sorting domain-containing protein [Chitinophagales bacterium]